MTLTLPTNAGERVGVIFAGPRFVANDDGTIRDQSTGCDLTLTEAETLLSAWEHQAAVHKDAGRYATARLYAVDAVGLERALRKVRARRWMPKGDAA